MVLAPALALAACVAGDPLVREPPELAAPGEPGPAALSDYRRPTEIPFPEDNAFTPARALLGRTLFFDPRLSGSGEVSCASCHDPRLSFGDGLPVGVGQDGLPLDRRSPTLLNLAWAPALFWDGRAYSLEEQALGPLISPREMNMPIPALEATLERLQGYRPLFEAAYPGEPMGADTAARALATFERTLVSPPSPFDAWVEGDEAALSEAAKRGFALFNGRAECSVCHSGWRFTDDGFYDLGLPGADLGRGEVLPGIVAVEHAFKTPTLRDVSRRAPYTHDGRMASLAAVVDYYADGGGPPRPSKSELIRPLKLSAGERDDLVAFMESLTSAPISVAAPALPREESPHEDEDVRRVSGVDSLSSADPGSGRP